ncbi:MAG TPA: dinitrogenase iron-molybdenum cofactor biosynthesis protein [Caldithrix abyssi]|uniref:Dinitrogenase iron-molybdenum cofactor biosynthesis protein n=1 Tax=Caldithrix abyssi TaxID=187145 RepID=A0A7V4TZM7_CALAY|nr:dinitrogenase iron-molybdenum cofactor biosynthesis protein [Caldithrix abyssi]
MKIAFTTKGTTWDAATDPRFGRTEYILVYDTETNELMSYDNRAIANEAHGAGPQTAQKLFEMNPDILITGNGPGGNAAAVLEKSGLKIYIGAGEMTVKDAYEAYKNGNLKEF